MSGYKSNNTGEDPFTAGQRRRLGFQVPRFDHLGKPRENDGPKPTVAPPAGVYDETNLIEKGE